MRADAPEYIPSHFISSSNSIQQSRNQSTSCNVGTTIASPSLSTPQKKAVKKKRNEKSKSNNNKSSNNTSSNECSLTNETTKINQDDEKHQNNSHHQNKIRKKRNKSRKKKGKGNDSSSSSFSCHGVTCQNNEKHQMSSHTNPKNERNKGNSHRKVRRRGNRQPHPSFKKELSKGKNANPNYENKYDYSGGDGREKMDQSSPITLNEEAFPTLQLMESNQRDEKNAFLKKNENNDDRLKHHKNGNINLWADIAHTGHKNSVTQHIQDQQERERLQYELDTYTRLDILRPDIGTKQDLKVNDDDNDDKKYNNQTELNNNKSNNVQNSKSHYHFGWTVKLLKVDKLKERWLRALQQKQSNEEQKRLKIIEDMEVLESKQHHELSHDYDDDNSISLSEMSISTLDSGSSCSSNNNESDGESTSTSHSTSFYLAEYLERSFPLHYAIIQNDEIAVRDLLSYPPDLTSRDKKVKVKLLRNMTNDKTLVLPPVGEEKALNILQFAILLNRPNVVKALLSSGRKYNLDYVTSTLSIDDVKNDLKCTALMIACEFNLEACVKVLIGYGPRMNMRHQSSGDCALHIACRFADPSTVKLLISSSRSNTSAQQRIFSKRNRKGETPFHLCCSLGRIDLVEVLLNSCSASCTAKVLEIEDNRGYTPLLSAIEAGDTHLVLHLISWRSNVRSSEILPKTCLTIAVGTKSLEMVSLLVDCLDLEQNYDYNNALCKTLHTFHDSSREGIEIIKLLIEAGADPFIFCTNMLVHSDEGKSFYCCSPLSIAVYKGQVNFVACMLDIFLPIQKNNQKERRMDRVLQKQPESYFRIKEEAEDDRIQKSGQDALVNAFLLNHNHSDRNEPISTLRLGCCLSILRRGICMNKFSLMQVMKQTGTSKESLLEMLNTDIKCFKASYTHKAFHANDTYKRQVCDVYGRSYADGWSSILLGMDWQTLENVSHGDIYCPWIQLQKKTTLEITNASKLESEICYLVCENKRFLAHKSILSSKSLKLEAAIRFAEMNEENDNSGRIEIVLDVSLDLVKLFIQHCYHGSMTYGLSLNRIICCQQLLDLYLLGQEYLCPSLSLECEMRLLSKDPYQCVCWHCCDELTFDQEKEEFTCCYHMKGPSKLMVAENLLGITAQLEDFEQVQNFYTINVKSDNFTELPYMPLEAIWYIAWMSTFLNFMDIVRSDSYLSVYHLTMSEYTEEEYSDQLECFGDDVAIILLQNCIDALHTNR